MAGKPGHIKRHGWAEQHLDHRGAVFVTGADVGDVVPVVDHAFAREKSRGEFRIMPRGAHGDAQGFAADTDFQRFFRCGKIADSLQNPLFIQPPDVVLLALPAHA